MSEDTRFRLGFIGCGSYASSLADAALRRSSKLKPVACFDVNAETAGKFAEKFEATTCSSIDELLSLPDIEGVVIASPNNAHRENCLAAAAARKHVFVDKPIANTIEDAHAIIDAVEGTGLTLAVGHNGRRAPGHRGMKKMIEAGAIGTPITVEANFSHSGGLGLTPQQWRWYPDQCPGLPLMQLGVHFADTVQYLLGDVTEVSSFMSHVATPAVDQNDVTVSLLKFDKGLLGYLGSNYATPSVYYVNVYGVEGNLHSDGGYHLLYRKRNANDKEPVELVGSDPQVEELEEFAECVRTGKRFEVDGRAGIMALAVVQAAIKSNATGRPVNIAELLAR